jgi:hypothetical protein
MKKKKEFVFTISFDSDNPNHVIAAEKLNSMGRKKAGFIARAVVAYMNISHKVIEPLSTSVISDQQTTVHFIDSDADNKTDIRRDQNESDAMAEFMSNLSGF